MLARFISNALPDGGGAIWMGLFLALFVFADYRRLYAPRNWALAGLLVSPPLLNDIQYWDRAFPTMERAIFTALFLITLAHLIWAMVLVRPAKRPAWPANVPLKVLKFTAALLVLVNVTFALVRRPDDAGTYTSLGAQRWLETGVIPYADSQLIGPRSPGGGAASAYGPLLYLAHMPFQLLVGAGWNPADAIVESPDYVRPRALASKLACLMFHLAGLWGLFAVVRRVATPAAAWGAVILYAGSPVITGLNAGHGAIAGLTFISHIAPTALVLLALAASGNALLSGALLAAAAGVLYFPAFMFPAWLGWHFWSRNRPWRFALGFGLMALAIAALVTAFTPVDPGQNRLTSAVSAFMHSAFSHQEGAGPRQYGATTFGFWGTHPALAAVFHAPLVGGSVLTRPDFLLFLGLCLGLFFWARRGAGLVTRLAALSAAVGAAAQIWKSHGVGTYIGWYLAPLILALVAGDGEAHGAGEPASRDGG
ncbi:MAG: hypothetical protein ACOY71_01450 [Gemmatimonadota bacterium]